MLNIRGLSGNSGTFPFFDCLCTLSNRNLPKPKRLPCQKRTIQSCKENHQKWITETNGNKKEVAKYQNCLNMPLLTKSFSDSSFHLPLMHITSVKCIKRPPTVDEIYGHFSNDDFKNLGIFHCSSSLSYSRWPIFDIPGQLLILYLLSWLSTFFKNKPSTVQWSTAFSSLGLMSFQI